MAASNSSSTMTEPQQFSLGPKILNGAIAGVVGVLAVFPMDLVKTRLQNQQDTGPRLYNSILDCFKKTFRNEGFLGMYRGVGVNVFFITPEKAIKLAGNDLWRHLLRHESKGLTLPREILSGGLAGMCQVIVTTPMELLKIQLQDAGRSATIDKVQVSGATVAAKRLTGTQIATQLMQEKGLFGLYRGLGSTLLRDVPFSALYFPLFAHLNALGPKKPGTNTTQPLFTLVAGIAAGGCASFFVNPMDVVKTRLQTIRKGSGEKVYTGIVDCFSQVYRKEGVKAFYKGALCRILVIAPLFGIAQAVYYLQIAEKLIAFGHRS